jgi:raffinose/stachyose/melibiose transport system substrate-binding protein
MFRNHRSALGLAALALGVAATTAACGGSDSTDNTSATPDNVGTKCDVYGDDITLKANMSEAGEVIAQEFDKLVSAFEDANPGVTVEVSKKDWGSASTTITNEMSSDSAPDVVMGNPGWTINGALWQAGLIKDLDPYAEAFGWNDEFPESMLNQNRFSDDATKLGEGNLVAVAPASQYVGVFYNKDLLSQIGITDPSTLDDKAAFLDALDKAKAAGITPVMLGDSEGWPMLHNISLFNGWHVSADDINAWVYNNPGSTYDDDGHLQGSEDFVSWVDNGYFNKDALATTFADATARFGQGESAFFITGTWALGDVSKALGDKAGFMLFPAGDSGKHEAVGGYSLPWSISSKTKYPDCAAAFIDFVTASPDAIAAQIAAGRPSSTLAGADAQIDDPLLKQMVSEYSRLTDDGGLFTWEDWPTTTMFELMKSEAQRLYNGETTPAEYDATIQKDWDDYMSTRG